MDYVHVIKVTNADKSLVRPPLRPRLGGRLMNQFRSSPVHFRFLASEGRIPELLEMLEVGPSHADVLPAFECNIFVHDVKAPTHCPNARAKPSTT